MIRGSIAMAAVLLSSCGTPTPPANIRPLPNNFGDGGTSDFYRWNGARLDQAGVMLRSEPLGDRFASEKARVARRILYASTDARFGTGVREASGMLYLPRAARPEDGWPLIVWSHGTMGVADVCAPSWKGSTPRDAAYIDRWLEAGFAVVAPDYQGLGTPGVHPYGFRDGESYSVLDAARAAISAYPDEISNRVILAGQSQGSGAVLSATYAAPRYAPDIHLFGTVASGLVWSAPLLTGEVDELTTMPDSPRLNILKLVAGSVTGTPLAVDRVVSDAAMPLVETARTACSRDMYGVAQRDAITPDNAYRLPARDVAASLSSLEMPEARLPVPVFVATGMADALIRPERQFKAVRQMCRLGTKVMWHPYAGVTHNGSSVFPLRDAIPFAQRLVRGESEAGNCAAIVDPGPLQAARSDLPYND